MRHLKAIQQRGTLGSTEVTSISIFIWSGTTDHATSLSRSVADGNCIFSCHNKGNATHTRSLRRSRRPKFSHDNVMPQCDAALWRIPFASSHGHTPGSKKRGITLASHCVVTYQWEVGRWDMCKFDSSSTLVRH